MLIGSITTRKASASLTEGLAQLWEHPQVRNELWRCSIFSRAYRPPTRRPEHRERSACGARAVHTDGDPRSVRRRERREAKSRGSPAYCGTRIAKPTYSLSRWTSRPDRSHRQRDTATTRSVQNLSTGRVSRGPRSTATPGAGTSVRQNKEHTWCCSDAEYRRSSVLVSRPGDLCLAPRRSPHRDHLAAPSPAVRRPLRGVRRRGRVKGAFKMHPSELLQLQLDEHAFRLKARSLVPSPDTCTTRSPAASASASGTRAQAAAARPRGTPHIGRVTWRR